MKRITTHHDGHGRMERLLVLATDEPATEPPGNSSHHHYAFFVLEKAWTEAAAKDPNWMTLAMEEIAEGAGGKPVAYIQFQRGPFDAEGSTPGTLGAAVLAALIDHYEGFQAGPLKDHWTAMTVESLKGALGYLRQRADERATRNVLGTMSK